MDARRWVGWGLLVLCAACSASKRAVRDASDSRRYVDETLGFELIQPGGEWMLDQTDEHTPEGLVIPVVFHHRTSGAQVVLQVAPAVATPAQFAERLVKGLRSQPGFVTSEPEPLPLSDSAVGFHFRVGDTVRGRVAVREGSSGYVFMMLATWPTSAPAEVPETVNALFESVRPLPIAPRRT